MFTFENYSNVPFNPAQVVRVEIRDWHTKSSYCYAELKERTIFRKVGFLKTTHIVFEPGYYQKGDWLTDYPMHDWKPVTKEKAMDSPCVRVWFSNSNKCTNFHYSTLEEAEKEYARIMEAVDNSIRLCQYKP